MMGKSHDTLNQTWLPDEAGESCLSLARYVNVLVCESPAIGTGGITGLPATVDWLICRLNHLLGKLDLQPLADTTLKSYVALVDASLKAGNGHANSLAAEAWNAIDSELNCLLARLADAAKESELPYWWELDTNYQHLPCHPIRGMPDLSRWATQVYKWVITPGTGYCPTDIPDRELHNVRVSLGEWEPSHPAYAELADADITNLDHIQAVNLLAKVNTLLANPPIGLMGVSLMDAALLLNEYNREAAKATKKKWQDTNRTPKLPLPLGTGSQHKKRGLYAVDDLLKFVAERGGNVVDDDLRGRLEVRQQPVTQPSEPTEKIKASQNNL